MCILVNLVLLFCVIQFFLVCLGANESFTGEFIVQVSHCMLLRIALCDRRIFVSTLPILIACFDDTIFTIFRSSSIHTTKTLTFSQSIAMIFLDSLHGSY